MPTYTKEWNVLSEDKSKNATEVSTTLTSALVTVQSGMWGSAMFGDAEILGGGFSNTYLSNVEKNVLSVDLSWNADRRLTSLFIATLTQRMGRWGEAMFGSEDLLGAGTLNYFEG